MSTTMGYDTTTWSQDAKTKGTNDVSTVINQTLSGTLTADKVKLSGDVIQASDGGNTITLDTSDNVTIAGDLTITGNDIKSSAGTTAITLSNDDVTIADNLILAATGKLYLDGGGGTYLYEATDGDVVLSANSNAIKISESTGTDNTVYGEDAWGNPHVGSSWNVAIGYRAGYAGTKTSNSDNNTLVGYESGYNVAGSSENTALGIRACYWATTGSSNVGVGPGAMAGNNASSITDTLENNVCVGPYTLFNIVDGNHNTALGRIAGQYAWVAGATNLTQVDNSVYIGSTSYASAATGVSNEIAIGYLAIGGGSDTFTCGNSSITNLMVDSNDACDLGKSDHVFDDIYASNDTIQTSDQRLKEEIIDTPIGLTFLNALRPVQFKWKDRDEVTQDYTQIVTHIKADNEVEDMTRVVQSAKTFSRKHQGLIAQEVKAVLDSQNINASDFAGYVDANIKDNVDAISLRYKEFIAPMIKAIQELSADVEDLKTKV